MRSFAVSLVGALLVACTPTMSERTTYATPDSSEFAGSAAIAEVEDLHAFFVKWFTGQVPDSDTAFDRFASALAPEFEMVVPSGTLLGRELVLAGVRGAYGQWGSGAAIEVRNAKAHALGGGLVRVSYEEWQELEGEWKGRRSTALVRSRGDGAVQWVHVHETWMSAAD